MPKATTTAPPGLPLFVFELHAAAARVASPPSNAMPEDLQRLLDELVVAVHEFEAFMPVQGGTQVLCRNVWPRRTYSEDELQP